MVPWASLISTVRAPVQPGSMVLELQVRQGEPPTSSSTAAISVSPFFQTWVTVVASALPTTLQKHHSRPTSAGNVSPASPPRIAVTYEESLSGEALRFIPEQDLHPHFYGTD